MYIPVNREELSLSEKFRTSAKNNKETFYAIKDNGGDPRHFVYEEEGTSDSFAAYAIHDKEWDEIVYACPDHNKVEEWLRSWVNCSEAVAEERKKYPHLRIEQTTRNYNSWVRNTYCEEAETPINLTYLEEEERVLYADMDIEPCIESMKDHEDDISTHVFVLTHDGWWLLINEGYIDK